MGYILIKAGKANANADALSRMFEEDNQTFSCFMISVEKEKSKKKMRQSNEDSLPVHKENSLYFNDPNEPYLKNCVCRYCQPSPVHSPSLYSCCNEIICQCNGDNFSINSEEYYNLWERQINGDAFFDYSEENQINIKEHIVWTMYGIDCQALENIKIRPDMNPEFLINYSWWNEPQEVQLENNVNYLKYIK
ncbi:hypothetical protein C1646_755766 [Rhizophagus diaphanus]|nr:hypothetical protein C1646_755766 [Rhizophagus diaphanus] [Rhizophagus sp. MUCL 43196]